MKTRWYHGTRRENVKSILKKGLLKSGNKPDRDWCIYVSDRIETAKIYGDAIFEIDMNKNDKITMIEKGNNEFLIWNDVNPKRINLLHGGINES